MVTRISIFLCAVFSLLLVSTAVLADAPGIPWRDHQPPFDFLFGNLIDNHQQSKLVGDGSLQGYIYISFTGGYIDGVPVAERANCENPDLDCRVGWKVKGVPFEAELVSKGPRKWLVHEDQLPLGPAYNHFHWVGKPYKPCGLVVGETYEGYLLQRTALTEFYWLGGNSTNGQGGHLVTPGMDPHSNIVTEWDDNDGGGGGHDAGGCDGHDGGSGGPPDGGGGSGGHEDGGCSGHEDGDDCSGHDGGSGGPPDEGGGSGGHEDGGCSGHEDGVDDGCSGHDAPLNSTIVVNSEFTQSVRSWFPRTTKPNQ